MTLVECSELPAAELNEAMRAIFGPNTVTYRIAGGTLTLTAGERGLVLTSDRSPAEPSAP
jgi:hypothetical protein